MADFGAVHCAATNEVLFDESLGRVLYDDYGDFAVGYVVGLAWADAVQAALTSPLQGEPRALASDCLVGAWIGTRIDFDPGTGPPTTSPADAGRRWWCPPATSTKRSRRPSSSATVGLDDNREGSAFEKIAAIRRGVLSGLPTCFAEITGS